MNEAIKNVLVMLESYYKIHNSVATYTVDIHPFKVGTHSCVENVATYVLYQGH